MENLMVRGPIRNLSRNFSFLNLGFYKCLVVPYDKVWCAVQTT